MRRFASALAVASLFGCSLALAQAPAQPGAPAAEPSPPPSAAPPSESTAQPGESTGEHVATAGKHMSYKACSKEAHTKGLKGTDRKQFIKDCEHGKTTTE